MLLHSSSGFFCIKNIFLYKTLGFFSEGRFIQPLQGTVLRPTAEHLQHLLETTALGFCSHLHYPFLFSSSTFFQHSECESLSVILNLF